jgi:hypothetical protein
MNTQSQSALLQHVFRNRVPLCLPILLLVSGCGASDELADFDEFDDETTAEATSPIVAQMFASVTNSFTLNGGSSTPISQLAKPVGYSNFIPVVEIRKYQVGDKDFAFTCSRSSGTSTVNMSCLGAHAPSESYGVKNLVNGQFTLLAFPSSVQTASTSPTRKATNGQTINGGRTTFASGTPTYFRTLWSMATGQDDDFEIDSYVDASNFYVRAYNGNSSSYAEVESVEIAPTPGLRATSKAWSAMAGNAPTSVTISRLAGYKYQVLASASSYITCGNDQFSFDVTCSNGTSSSTCTISVTGGNANCSTVKGFMVVLESQ